MSVVVGAEEEVTETVRLLIVLLAVGEQLLPFVLTHDCLGCECLHFISPCLCVFVYCCVFAQQSQVHEFAFANPCTLTECDDDYDCFSSAIKRLISLISISRFLRLVKFNLIASVMCFNSLL